LEAKSSNERSLWKWDAELGAVYWEDHKKPIWKKDKKHSHFDGESCFKNKMWSVPYFYLCALCAGAPQGLYSLGDEPARHYKPLRSLDK
jgi:hypothetical protein